MKKWLLISFIILSFLTLIGIGVSKYFDSKETAILATKNTSMNAYEEHKKIATYFVNYLNVDSESEYKAIRNKYKPLMSKNVFNEYFLNEDYLIGYKDVQVSVNSIRGQKIDRGYLFKLDLTYKSEGTPYNFVYLVTIKDMKVTSIEKL